MNTMRKFVIIGIFILSFFFVGIGRSAVHAVVATSLALGDSHSCALVSGGSIKCWGKNEQGQLGNGTSISSTTPVDVIGITGATSISAGGYHSCALFSGGSIKCWGMNGQGQLGIGNYNDAATPVDVTGITGATSISAGGRHSCALFSGGSIKCWGYNLSGQLGNNSTSNSSVPVSVTDRSGNALTGATALALGEKNSCALFSGGSIKCWGYNFSGQLGNNSTTNSSVPVSVTGITNAKSISSGYIYSCALLSDGSIKCWGSNAPGQLGNNSTTNSSVPVSVTDSSGNALTGATALYSGGQHSCALFSGGSIKCWGHNGVGQLGNNSTSNSSVPVSVIDSTGSALTGATSLYSGGFHSCAFFSNGSIKCWGYNRDGQLGDGTTNSQLTPVDVLYFALTPTPIPKTTPRPTLTPTPPLGCVCDASSTCTSTCNFDKHAFPIIYGSSIKCSLSGTFFPTSPTTANKTDWCKASKRTKGDADGNGIINTLDYFYYVAGANGGKIPVSVNPDFNGDGEVGASDREIILKSLNP